MRFYGHLTYEMKIIHFINSMKNLEANTVEASIAVYFFFCFHFYFKIVKYYIIFYLGVCVLTEFECGGHLIRLKFACH